MSFRASMLLLSLQLLAGLWLIPLGGWASSLSVLLLGLVMYREGRGDEWQERRAQFVARQRAAPHFGIRRPYE